MIEPALEDDERQLSALADELCDAILVAIPAWVRRTITERAAAEDVVVGPDSIEAVIAAIAPELGPELRRILQADVDSGAGSPLAAVRAATGPITALLEEAGVPKSRRDEFSAAAFPLDLYEVGPATFADIDPSLHEPGLMWGAARAHVHLRRRRRHGTPLGSPPMSDRPPFPDVLAMVADVEGWMTDGQARLLYDRGSDLGEGTRAVEIGSFRGRSMIVLASAAGPGVELVAIDPHGGGDRGPQEIAPDQAKGDADFDVFHDNLVRAGVADRVRHVRRTSNDAHADVDGDVDLLYIDGAHRFGPARADIVEWGNRVSGGGTLLIHDSFSSIGVTLALLTTTFIDGRWRYIGRSRSMAEYERANLRTGERIRNGLRQALQLPWFIRNVLIKVLLVAKLGPLTRVLGHRTNDWPY